LQEKSIIGKKKTKEIERTKECSEEEKREVR
jgi:hypothetical protein